MDWGLALTLLGIGGAFLLAALTLALWMRHKQKKCTAGAEAIVTGFKAHISENGCAYHPVYEYTVGGILYKKTSSASSRQTPRKNTAVPIMYNPHNPRQSYIQGYDDKICRILAVLFTVIGCIPVVICVCIAFFSA